MGPALSPLAPAHSSPLRTRPPRPRSFDASAGPSASQSAARGGGLSEDIAFLGGGGGASPGALASAAAEARRLQVSAHAQLIASGAVTDDLYFAALAKHLGVDFEQDVERLGPGPAQPAAALSGVATAGARLLIAPDPPMLRALLHMRRRGNFPAERLVLTTPRRFAAWARRSAGAVIARRASDDLRAADPALSAASGLTRPQGGVLAGLLAAAVAALLFSPAVWQGLLQSLTLVMAAGVLLRLFAGAAACGAGPPPAKPLSDAALPRYTIIVPLYREAEVARKLVASLERIDYPRAKLDIKIVLEADDRETRAAFEALALPAYYELIAAPDGAPRTKPRALNVALPFAKGSLVTVYDAEDEPERDQLRLAAARFAAAPDDLGCLQARLAIDNSDDSWIAALFAIEYAALFDVINPGLSALGLPMPLGGTSNHFRATALRETGGWDAWNVTEDADLGLRLARFGYGVEALASTTHEEAPAHLRAWIAQRRRWQKGWMQTLITFSRDPRRLVRELGRARAAAALLLLAAGAVGPLLGPALTALMLIDAAAGDLLRPQGLAAILASTFWCSSFVLCLASILWPACMGIRRRGLYAEAAALPMLPVYYTLMSLAAWQGLIELARKPFHWSKTRHGLARSSRRRRPRGNSGSGNSGSLPLFPPLPKTL